jgi:predicted ATPase
LHNSRSVAETAEKIFRRALTEARRQQTLAWELRAATSLALPLCKRGRRADAKILLQPIYDRFAEGFDTADLITARGILDHQLSNAERA